MSDPGHKASEHLIRHEAYRRIMAGRAPETLEMFARQLLDWLLLTHPNAAPTTTQTIENQVRDIWHRRHELIRGG
jgi:hypothetical protein